MQGVINAMKKKSRVKEIRDDWGRPRLIGEQACGSLAEECSRQRNKR